MRILAVLTIAIFLLPQFAWGDDGYRLMVESYYDNKLKDIIQSQEIKDLLIAANKQQAEWGLDDFETLKATWEERLESKDYSLYRQMSLNPVSMTLDALTHSTKGLVTSLSLVTLKGVTVALSDLQHKIWHSEILQQKADVLMKDVEYVPHAHEFEQVVFYPVFKDGDLLGFSRVVYDAEYLDGLSYRYNRLRREFR